MLQACLLAAIAGYADAVGLLKNDAFAGLMTGNTILLGIEISKGKFVDALFHTGIIAAFLAGVIAARALIRLGLKIWLALSLVALLLVFCSFVARDVAAIVLAFAMGLQNSAANRFGGFALNTVFITGNLQKLGEGLIAWAWPSRDGDAKEAEGVAIFGAVWLTYAVGAVLGAVASEHLSFPLLFPAAFLPFVMLSIQDLGLAKRRDNRPLARQNLIVLRDDLQRARIDHDIAARQQRTARDFLERRFMRHHEEIARPLPRGDFLPNLFNRLAADISILAGEGAAKLVPRLHCH